MELPNTLDCGFCAAAVAVHGVLDILNTNQGSRFTSIEFTQSRLDPRIILSVDGRGRCLDHFSLERLRLKLKSEHIYPKSNRSLVVAYA